MFFKSAKLQAEVVVRMRKTSEILVGFCRSTLDSCRNPQDRPAGKEGIRRMKLGNWLFFLKTHMELSMNTNSPHNLCPFFINKEKPALET